jgi:hypothetical protein
MASRCGKHTELASNAHTKVTRCTCGVVHLHFLKTGITMQLPMEAFKATSSAFIAALDKLEPSAEDEAEPVVN